MKPQKLVEATGVVGWFHAAKGFGFLRRDGEENNDVLVHFTAIQSDDLYKTLEHNDRVRFEMYQDKLGWKAHRVWVVQKARTEAGDARTPTDDAQVNDRKFSL